MQKNNHLIVVTTSYNNEDWVEKNLIQLFKQSYTNYTLDYTDDNSSDNTLQKVKAVIKKYRNNQHIILRFNDARKGSLANHYNAIHNHEDEDIIIIYDGDDWFKDNHVLSYVNQQYQNSNLWLTYGQFEEYPSGKKGFCRAVPDHIFITKLIRFYNHVPSHLRTFKTWLFKRIKKTDLTFSSKDLSFLKNKMGNTDVDSLVENEFFPMTGDIAMMIPMLEMAQKGHFKFIDRILLIYNNANSINDYKVNKLLQRALDTMIRIKQPYRPIC